jgi:peptidoglycan hydrolase-like protein with peptidoglycan-binding domain
MRRRATATAAGLVAATAAGAVAAVSLTGARAGPAGQPGAARLATAEVQRRDLAASALTEGTMGYRASTPVVNGLAGTYTWLPRPGRVIDPGGTLYRVDDAPVVLMAGRVPAWRPLQPGMTSGPDVRQLQSGLIAGHYGAGVLGAANGDFGPATLTAVEQWQAARGLPVTGVIPLGQVVFLAGPVRVGGWQSAPGDQAAPGQQPYLVTTDRRVITVPVTSDLPVVRLGQRVSIVLPTQVSTPGVVSAIGPALVPGGPGGAAQQLTVTPLRPASTGTGTGVPVQISVSVQVVRDALAVPVSALLALAGGGYGLEVVLPSGAHRLTGVSVGLFASGEVQVSGRGLTAGMRVVTAQ